MAEHFLLYADKAGQDDLRNGVWAFAAGSAADHFHRAVEYTLDGVAGPTTCPTLILDAENAQFFRGQPQRVQAALTCPPHPGHPSRG
ncbi:hypothetical protein [Streptomyces murinus]|uniref:hypothetical protein n=1 Tax=Streptomyces murinus TaxID=33900 RepID=UPI00380BD921